MAITRLEDDYFPPSLDPDNELPNTAELWPGLLHGPDKVAMGIASEAEELGSVHTDDPGNF